MNRATLRRAMKKLAEADRDVAQALEEVGMPEPRVRPAGFQTLLSTIVGQQISAEAARSIQGRVDELLPESSPEALLALGDSALRGAGMSGRKVEYAKGLAEAITRGEFDVDALAELEDEAAIETISSLRGFGRWSAEIYLMFSLGRRDIFPSGDLALRVAVGRLKRLEERPTPGQARDLVAHWTPYRSAGSLFLWRYYRGAPG
ncbi:MAG: DNA-3-methyladenine glycosylase 2 family protein [Myxococcota bacterium]|nr:DNA-3-methyladenine glycosylase 2 family protein [Myxococcota bacterium]